jgi:PAS domain S-box-containing protein
MNGPEIRVLSIEDNAGDALLIEEKLTEGARLGWDLPPFAVEWADSLKEGMTRLDAGATGQLKAIDVVLTDLDLPDSQAGKTFAALRKRFPHMPIVVLTGREDKELARTSVRAGAQDYLFKNEATGSLLAHALIYAIERQENAQALQEAHDALEQRVEERTVALRQANKKLRAENAARRVVEQALQQEKDKAERYLNIAPSIIIALDTRGHIILLNKTGADILECDQETVLGKNWFDTFIPHHLQDKVRGTFRRLIQGETQLADYVENAVVTGQGHERIIRWHNTLLRNDDQKISGLLSSGENITKRKEIEKALKKRVKELTCLYAISRDLHKEPSLDDLGRRILLNLKQAMQFPEITVTVIELADRRFSDDETFKGLSPGLHAEIRTADQVRGHLWIYYKEQRPFLLPEEQNLINGVAEALGLWLERKEAEEKLHFQAHLLDAIQQAIIVTDIHGCVTYWNPYAERLYGWSEEEALGKTTIKLIASEQSRQHGTQIMSRLRSGESWAGEYLARHRDNTPMLIHGTMTPLHNEEGQMTHIIGISNKIAPR